MTDNQKTTLFNYNLEIYKNVNNVLVKHFTLKDDSKSLFSLSIYDHKLSICDQKLPFIRCITSFYKKEDYYICSSSYVDNYKHFEADYTINRSMFFRNGRIHLVVDSRKTFEYIKQILYKSTDSEYITIDDNKIKALKIIDNVSWYNRNDSEITNNFHTYEYYNNDFVSESMKYLLELLNYNIKFKFDYISIGIDITEHISIEECEINNEDEENESDFEDEEEDKNVKFKDYYEEDLIITINIQNMLKSNTYYSLLITYCLIQLKNGTFIDWLLRRMDTVGRFRYDESYLFSVKECKLNM